MANIQTGETICEVPLRPSDLSPEAMAQLLALMRAVDERRKREKYSGFRDTTGPDVNSD